MKINAEKHNYKIKVLLFFIFLTLFSTYIIANTYKQLVDYKNTNEYVFTITPKNTIVKDDSLQKNGLKSTYDKVVEFFSPTRTLIPVLVIPAEETKINDPNEASKRDAKTAIAEASREYPQDIDHANRIDPRDIDDANRIDPQDIDEKGKGTYSGGGGEAKWVVGVSDEELKYKKGIIALVDIFADARDSLNRKIIYPGISGNYYFTVDNTINDYNILYNISFTETCLKYIPMEYRIKYGSVYLGQNDKWYSAGELSKLIQNKPLDKNNKASYTLEWRWPESNNDNQYIKCGGTEYTLKITVYAQAR